LQPDKAGTAPAFRHINHAERHAEAHMLKAKEGNIYDLVECAAVRRQVPRLDLWETALRAILEENLRPLNLTLPKRHDPIGVIRSSPPQTYRDWLSGILRAVVDRRFDPNSVAHEFKKIIVRCSDFESLLRKGNIGGRGPKPGKTGLQEADRKLFAEIKRLLETGQAQSPYGAALTLADRLPGRKNTLPESKAKRVSALYRKECPES
jgi:hypothetical protein